MLEHTLAIIGAVLLPILRTAIDRIGRERPPERRVLAGRRIGRIERAVAGAVAHQHFGKFLRRAVVEAARYLVDIVYAEENIVGARDVGIESGGAIGRRMAQREMQGDQAVVAPVPGFGLLAHGLREQLLAGHLHGGGKIDGAGDEFAAEMALRSSTAIFIPARARYAASVKPL